MAESCGHEGCRCEAREDREDGYCSDYCAEHGSKPGHVAHDCGCGHDCCTPAAAGA
ncbi:MAG: hypothetical protein QOI73_198 [Solirubrobacteraceae bacterium]|jgi:hypothetical protein|nr:hypothetical protein [Solirubrobacteraceae bacterium]